MKVFCCLLFAALLTVPVCALAQDKKDAPSAASFEVVDAKICSGIKDKEAIDDKAKFSTGEKAWVWLKLRPKGDTELRMRWYIDDREIWTTDPVAVQLGRTWYNKLLNRPGSWKVEILDPNDEILHSATLTVEGEALKTEEEAGEAPVESQLVEVLELKLAKGVENREPVDEGTTFDQGGQIYTWVKLLVKEDQTNIKMRWYIDDRPIYTSEPISVSKSHNWRTWLSKTLNRAGDWKVEILDADDKPVHATNFTVK